MMGGDLPTTDEATLRRLTNPLLRELLTASRGNGEIIREPLADGELIVWTAESTAAPRHYLAVFSTASEAVEVEVPISSVAGDADPGEWRLTDAWDASVEARTATESVRAIVASHGVRWFALDPNDR